MKNDIEKIVISIVADVTGVDEQEITSETNLVTDLDVDSIKAIEITVALEKKFKVSVREEDVPKIVSIKQAVELVQKLLSQGTSHAKA